MTQRHPRGLTRRIAAALVACAMSLTAGASAAAPPSSDAKVDQLTDLVVEAVPLGKIFGMLAEADPKWPMQDKPNAVSAGQLACMRRELSPAGHREATRRDVIAYMAREPEQVDADIRVLSDGAAMLMGRLMLAGAEGERTGNQVTPEQVMSDSTPEQLAAFMAFMTSPDYRDIRSLAGIGEAFDAGQSAAENEAAGEGAGQTLAMRVMLGAMSRCDVPTSVLFAP